MKQKLLMTASVWSHIRNFHLPYLREFQNQGWETHIACAGAVKDAPYTDKVIEISFEKRMMSLANLNAALALRRLIQAERYELIVTHTSLASFFTRLAVKGMKKRPRLVCVMHGYLFDNDTPFFKRQLLLGAERLTAPETDLLLLMNEWDYRTAKQYRLGREIGKIPGIGVDFSKLDSATVEDGLQLREQLGIPKDAFVLLYPAEFSNRKSQRVLIETMHRLPSKVWLVLCGEGKRLPTCMGLADKLNVNVRNRVLFPGQVTNIATWYRMADALATSSRSEGLPFNVMEAMYCGLPVVASAVKGHADLIVDGENGLLYPYGDAKACADCVQRLLASAQLREGLGRQARESVMQYGLDAVLDAVLKWYELGYQSYSAMV